MVRECCPNVSLFKNIVSMASFCFQHANYAYATRQGILTEIPHASTCKNLRARASEHLSNFCEQFEQRPNFTSTFKLDGTIRYPFILNQWRQNCSPLQVIEPMTQKNWGRGCVIFGERKTRTSLKIFWINNTAIIELGFRRIWRILRISEDVIHLGYSASVDNILLDLQNSSYPTQRHSINFKS